MYNAACFKQTVGSLNFSVEHIITVKCKKIIFICKYMSSFINVILAFTSNGHIVVCGKMLSILLVILSELPEDSHV